MYIVEWDFLAMASNFDILLHNKKENLKIKVVNY